jgi:hypothetical protein
VEIEQQKKAKPLFIMEDLICPEPNCGGRFSRRYNLNRHYQRFHMNAGIVEVCQLCGQIFESCDKLQKHYRYSHRPSRKFFLKESAFKRAFVTFRYNFSEDHIDFAHAQSSIKNLIKERILVESAKKTVCRVSLVFIARMNMLDHSGEAMNTASIPFRSPSFLANASVSGNITKNIIKSFNHQADSLEQFIQSGSNWQFERALVFDIEIAGLAPIVTGCDEEKQQSEKKIDLSTFKNRRFLYNACNRDNKCFLYCIAYFLQGEKLKNDAKLRKYVKKFNIRGLQFPITIAHIKRFLKLNEHLNLRINILYRNTKGEIFPLEYNIGSGKKTVNLLMVNKENSGVKHFLLITNVNKFLRHVYVNEDKNYRSYQKKHYCLNCLNSFYSVHALTNHETICSMNKPRMEIAPTAGEDDKIYFKNTEKQHPMEYIAFLDFECALPKKNNFCVICKSLKCRCDASFVDIISKQEAIGYSFVILGEENKIIHEKTYLGNNAAVHFIQHLLNEEKRWIKSLLEYSEDIKMTSNDYIKFNQKGNCYICNKVFSETTVKCRDHSHLSGKFLGASCQACNLRRRRPTKLKIFIHNGSRYNAYTLITQSIYFAK